MLTTMKAVMLLKRLTRGRDESKSSSWGHVRRAMYTPPTHDADECEPEPEPELAAHARRAMRRVGWEVNVI